MNLAKNEIAVILSEEGRRVLRMAACNLPDTGAAAMFVEDTDDLGLWIRTERQDGNHLLLIRWQYVLSIDMLPPEKKVVGIRN